MVVQHYLSIDHMVSKRNYFGEAMDICEEFGLLPIMQLRCNYDVDFSTSKPQMIRWMTKDKHFEASWVEFVKILGYHQDANGWRIHDTGRAMDKEVLRPLYIEGWGVCGTIEHLKPVYDIMLRV
jgi:hypothetical protein